MRFSRVAALLLSISAASFAQEFRSTLSGVVTDPAGAVVPNVTVIATETRTGTKSQTVSDSAGQYTIPFLLPGNYEISAESSGFKRYVRTGVEVASGSHPVIDITLTVGETSQSIDVTEDVSLVNRENASMGQTITAAQVEDFPLNGRTPMMLAQLSIGVIPTGQPSLVHPFDNSGAAGWSIGGTPAQTSELLMDGSPDATWDGRLAYSPPQDAVREVNVKAFDNDAAYGHTGSGTANQVLKTGTNSFHGSMWEFTQASKLDAVNFFTNKSGSAVPVTHFNQYGLTAGGPLIIPKIYNGKNRLFWFFAWENLDDAQPNNSTLGSSTSNYTTVPTAAERNGDFSALNYTIYNPFSAVLNGSVVTRMPFQTNNVIPTNLLSPVALNYLKYYPMPNTTPLGANGFDNYVSNFLAADTYDNELGRMDYNITDRSRVFFDVRHNDRVQAKSNYFDNIATGTNLARENWGATVDEVYTLNPRTVLDVRANFTRMNEVHYEPSEGFDPTTLGFPSLIASTSNYAVMPIIQFGSCGSQTSFQCLGDNSASKDPSQSYQLFGDVVKVMGTHILKIGGDVRQYRINTLITGNSGGGYTFGNAWTRQASNSSSTTVVGQDFASFMLGLPTAGQFDLNSTGSYSSYYYSPFVQDDWRVSKTLTVNLGVRFDHDTPYSEKYGRTVDGFATNEANPIAAAAIAAYAKSPIAQLPVGSFAVPGGLTFPTGGGSVYQSTSHIFSPRIGFAWSPSALHNKTVIRGGFGIFTAPVTIASLATTGAYSSNPLVDQEGFSQTTTLNVPTNNLTPTATLSNPFPTGLLAPVGSTQGLSTFLGQTVSFLNPNMKDPYSIRWNLGVQHEFGKDLLLEAVYMGNHAVHLPIAFTQLNVLPRQFLSTLPTRDQTTINALTATVTNPLAGLEPGTSLNNATTTAEQLLSVYPEFPAGSGSGSTGVIEQNLTNGSSYFESLNLRAEKRLSHGLSLIGVYMYSKLVEEDSWLNDTDQAPEKRISPFDHTQHFVVASTYALPIGKNRAVNLTNRWADGFLGGWILNGIYTAQTGAPLVWSNGSTTTIGDYVYFGGNLDVNPRQVNGVAFNTSDFDTKSADQFQFHIRTFSTTFGNLRQEGINNFDASLLKSFKFTERSYFQIRFESFNIVNHPTFSAPNTTATSSGFGTITAQANLPRQIQLGARLVW
jgi:Carboxypeptidase regulatory-like domain